VQAESPLKASYDACALPTEGPVRRVELPAFSIARFPVTIEEYRGFVEYGGYEHRPYWHAGGFGLFRWPWYWAEQLRYPNRPVTGVSWYEAMAYCCWRGARTRLPAEAMWERAARGDSNRLFPWGDDFPDDLRLNYGPRGIGRPTPVGFFPLGATPEGVLDMAGNVFEWCLDAWSPTPDGSGIIADAAAHRVVRGGGFGSCTLFVRAAFRGHYEPERRAADLGFRICSL
jgi:formylglycine-generating enzyme required for sulfatase activity